MKEVWQRASVVMKLKQDLQSKLNMLVNEDKLDQVLSSAKKQLQSVNRSHNLTQQQPSSSLAVGMQKYNFYGGAGGVGAHP